MARKPVCRNYDVISRMMLNSRVLEKLSFKYGTIIFCKIKFECVIGKGVDFCKKNEF